MVNNMIPTTLHEALEGMKIHHYIPYVGGTDLMVSENETRKFLFLHKVKEMRSIEADEAYIRIGASVTFTEILQSPLTHPLLKDAVREIAAPAIRNLGTIGGNIGNGSAKADSVLIFYVFDALVRVASTQGERIIPIKDFYKGRKKLDLAPEELIIEVLMPKLTTCTHYYHKIGARKALAISRVAFAALMDIEENIIVHCATGFGAISEKVVRRDDFDRLLIGKTIEEAKKAKAEYLSKYKEILNPIQGRISAEYRKTVCMNLLEDFLASNGI